VPTPGRVHQRDPALHGPDAALDPDPPWPTAEVGTLAAVVGDLAAQVAGAVLHRDVDDAGPRVLGRVGQCLGDGVVGSDSIGSGSRNPPSASAAGDPASELAQVVEDAADLVRVIVQLSGKRVDFRGCCAARAAL
jgi:hypothetical protein